LYYRLVVYFSSTKSAGLFRWLINGLKIEAVDPITGKICCDVFISYERLHKFFKPRGLGAVLECRYCVPEVLQKPTAIFEGLCQNEDEPRNRGCGWRCYCGIPSHDYSEDGTALQPRKNKVFLVFVTEELVAYNWRWEKCCPDKPELPINYQTRFRDQKL